MLSKFLVGFRICVKDIQAHCEEAASLLKMGSHRYAI